MSDDMKKDMLSHCLAIKEAEKALWDYMNKIDNALIKPGQRITREFIHRKRS